MLLKVVPWPEPPANGTAVNVTGGGNGSFTYTGLGSIETTVPDGYDAYARATCVGYCARSCQMTAGTVRGVKKTVKFKMISVYELGD